MNLLTITAHLIKVSADFSRLQCAGLQLARLQNALPKVTVSGMMPHEQSDVICITDCILAGDCMAVEWGGCVLCLDSCSERVCMTI